MSTSLFCMIGFSVLILPFAGWIAFVGLAVYFLAAESLALFGASCETALSGMSRSAVLALAEKDGLEDVTQARLARLGTYRLSARLARFLGNALLVVGVAFVTFGDVFKGDTRIEGVLPFGSVIIVLGITFAVTFLVNDVIVRQLVRSRADAFLYAALPALEVLRWALAPLRLPLVWLVRVAFRVRLESTGPSVREEVLESVEEGEREGMLSAAEADMIESIMDLERSTVKDVMTLRTDMVMIPADALLEDAVELINAEGVSRIPVYGEDRDDVVGVLYARDLLGHWKAFQDAGGRVTVARVMRSDPFFVPQTKGVAELLGEMRANQVHMAIVIDEFQGTTGLVTIEDLIEEIVGEIRDEYDDEEEDPPVVTPEQIAAGTIHVEGRTPIEEVNRALSVELPVEDDFETLSGLIFHQLGNVPQVGDRVDVDGVALTVLEADERTVKRVKVEVSGPGVDVPGPDDS